MRVLISFIFIILLSQNAYGTEAFRGLCDEIERSIVENCRMVKDAFVFVNTMPPPELTPRQIQFLVDPRKAVIPPIQPLPSSSTPRPKRTYEIERVRVGKAPSIYMYGKLDTLVTPVSSSKWRSYTATGQDFSLLPENIRKESTKWHAPSYKGLYVTFAFNWPIASPNKFFYTTQLASISVVQTLQDFGLNATLKWPNDVRIDGKKVSGIAGSLSRGTTLINIGINTTFDEEDFKEIDQPATNISEKPIDPERLLDVLTYRLAENVYKEEAFKDSMLPFFKEKMEWIGRKVTLTTKEGEIHKGTFESLNDLGFLNLRNEKGLQTFSSGHLRLDIEEPKSVTLVTPIETPAIVDEGFEEEAIINVEEFPEIPVTPVTLVTPLSDEVLAHIFENEVYDFQSKVFQRTVKWQSSVGTTQNYKVYQRNDIDWDRIRTTGNKKFIGKTNREAALKGLSPELEDEVFATIHHINQDSRGPLVEASTRYHGIKSRPAHDIIHSLYGLNKPHPEHPVDHKEWEKEKREYWKMRAQND